MNKDEKLLNEKYEFIKDKEVLTEALTPQGIEKIKKMLDASDTRTVAVNLVDICLRSVCGLTSLDLPDTAIFMNGLDNIEELLDNAEYEEAWNSAKETAQEMLEDEGFPMEGE